MKVVPYLVVLIALLCLAQKTSGEPSRQSEVDVVPLASRINPRFYVKGERNDQRSVVEEDEEDTLTGDEEADVTEDEDAGNELEDEAIETYYPVSDDSGQTYLIPESVLELMAEKQETNDDSDTYLVPNGSVRLDDEDSEDGDNNSAIILSEADDNSLVDGSQYIAIVQEPESYGKAQRNQFRRGGMKRRRAGGVRRRRRRGGSQQGLKRRRTRKKIRRGGGGGGGRRRRRGGGGGGGGGRIRLGRIRVRPRRGSRFRF